MTTRPVARVIWTALLVPLLAAVGPRSARAQPLGTFRWQLQPFCNVITTEVEARDGRYHVNGVDDLCGGQQRASVVGLAFPNPDGSLGIGLTSVTPGAMPVHIDATIDPSSGNGAWRDSAGNAGVFVLTPGAGTGGATRPVPAGGIRPGSITSAEISPGSITGAALEPVSIANTVSPAGPCAPGASLTGFAPDGRGVCQGVRPPVSTTLPYGEAFYPALVVGADGLPAVAHVDLGAAGLRLTHCGNLSCTQGTTSTVVWPAQALSPSTRLMVGADGVTTVVGAVMNQPGPYSTLLRVARCSTPSCLSGTVTTDLPIARYEGGMSPEFTPNGRLAIAWVESVSNRHAVRLLFCGDQVCGAGNVVVDVATDTGPTPDLLFDVGRTRVTASGEVVVDVMRRSFADTAWSYFQTRCTAGGCTALAARPPLAATSIVIGGDGLPVGLPAAPLGAPVPGDGTLRVVHCDDLECLTSTIAVADAPASRYVGQDAHLAIGADGLPVVSHWDLTAQALRITRCGNAACTSGNVSATVDDPAQSVGSQSRIAIGSDGLPLIVHRDAAAQALRVTKCTTRDCR